MSSRTIICTTAAIAALFAVPASALAVPAHDSSAVSQPTTIVVGPPTHFGQDPVRHVALSQPSTQAPIAPVAADGSGSNALTVVLLAGATLLLVAAAGYYGGRALSRRRTVRS